MSKRIYKIQKHSRTTQSSIVMFFFFNKNIMIVIIMLANSTFQHVYSTNENEYGGEISYEQKFAREGKL